MLLENKVVIITGAASLRGIGRATARLFAQHGARIVIVDLDAAVAASAAAEIGPIHLGLAGDVTDKAACERAARETIERYGQIDVLVNNAGVTQPIRLADISAADYDFVTGVSLRGTLYMSQSVIPHMRTRKAGSIVCMSSVSAQRGGGIFGGSHYSAAKGGVLGLARAMARELGPDRIRVNSIAPGLIKTDITGDMLTSDLTQEILKSIPLNRLGEPSDVAACCLFLACDLAAYVTGATLDVNGGMHIH